MLHDGAPAILCMLGYHQVWSTTLSFNCARLGVENCITIHERQRAWEVLRVITTVWRTCSSTIANNDQLRSISFKNLRGGPPVHALDCNMVIVVGEGRLRHKDGDGGDQRPVSCFDLAVLPPAATRLPVTGWCLKLTLAGERSALSKLPLVFLPATFAPSSKHLFRLRPVTVQL